MNDKMLVCSGPSPNFLAPIDNDYGEKYSHM